MRLLAVVAHPDDESFGCGSLLALAARAGWATTVVCATRGEAGESRVPVRDLAAAREIELRAAAEVLGVRAVHVLAYRDSGMDGPPPPGALVAADPAAVVSQVRSVLHDVQPDVVVTLDASDGHRDHACIRDATLAAVDTAVHQPAATYLWCLARSSMRRWADHLREAGGGEAYLAVGELGTPDDEITTRLDARSVVATRWQAIRAHETQASPYDGLPADLQDEFLSTDRLRLVRGTEVLAGALG